MQIQQQIPSFVLYRLNSPLLKACFESQQTKILCSLSGPTYGRTHNIDNSNGIVVTIPNLQPTFNITINLPQKLLINDNELKHQGQFYQVNRYTLASSLKSLIKQVLSQTVLQNRYLRMVFEVSIDVVEVSENIYKLGQQVLSNILFSNIINLLCYTMLLGSVELKTTFTATTVCLNNDSEAIEFPNKIIYESMSHQNSEKQFKKHPSLTKLYKIMTIVVQHRQKQLIYAYWKGSYNFIHYQKVVNYCLNMTEELQAYIVNKAQQQQLALTLQN